MRLSLQTRLMALCIGIAAFAMLLVSAVNFFTTQIHTQQLIHTQATQLAQTHARNLGLWLSNRQAIIASLKPYANAHDVLPHLQQAAQSGAFDQTFVGFPDKRALFSEQRQRPADYDPTSRAWFKGAQAAGGAFVSAPYIGASTGKMLITFANLVGSSSDVQAVVAGDVMMESVLQTIRAIHPSAQSYAFLVSGDGNLIAHPDSDLTLKPLSSLHPQLNLQSMQQAGSAWQLGDREGLLFTQAVPNSDWHLAIVMDSQEMGEALSALATTSVLTTLLSCALAAALLLWTIRQALQRLSSVHTAITAAGTGDFSNRLPEKGHDELTQIALAYNRFADNIAKMLHRIRDSSSSVEVASSEIAAGNQDLSVRTEQQADAVAQTVASIDKLAQNVQLNADHALRANELARSASNVAQKGGTAVSSVVDVMAEINQSSRQIADIIGVIDGIAFQTNILALNAAVEAARAGEQGRGFAVVAGEVRSLAQRSAAAAREISTLINDSVSKVHQGGTMVQQAGQTMQEIVDSVQRVTGIMGDISQASQAQTQEIGHINHAILSMEDSTQQNTALVEEAAAAAASLREQAATLAQMVNGFKLSHSAPASRAHTLSAPSTAAPPQLH